MHRIAALPGGWNPQSDGVVFVDQTPAPIVFLTTADTEIQTIAHASDRLPPGFPDLRVTNLLNLQQPLTIDTYIEDVLDHAQVIILRLLGGRAYWSYGLEMVQESVARSGASLIVLPGDDRPDPDLMHASTVSLAVADQLWRYLIAGGVENLDQALKFVANACLQSSYTIAPPQIIPQVGVYGEVEPSPYPQVGLLFYRAHYLAGNLAAIDALCHALKARQLNPIPVYVGSLRDPDTQAEVQQRFAPKDAAGVEVILNTTSFAIAQPDDTAPSLWHKLNVPVLQVILSSSPVEQWQAEWRGLSPRDIAMNVALPEVDGRIISRAVSFKAVQTRHAALETDVVVYEPVADRIQFVADLAANWVTLRRTPASKRKIALILANYPTRDGRLANGVGLDTPASCLTILDALQQAGYTVENPPTTTEALIDRLTAGITNDPEGRELRPIQQFLSADEYHECCCQLPIAVQQGIEQRWGTPKGDWPVSGLSLGNIFVGIQPARGYDQDPALNYHAPDLEPTHAYLAFYHWLRRVFGVQAIVHVGKHGNLEWLPGKSIALSDTCYPEAALGPLPHLYPFIVNDPGEGAQAKRRAQAVIVDHLTPPLTRAELYGPLQQLEALVDEYYDAQSLDPSRSMLIRDRITALLQETHLNEELGTDPDDFVTLDRYLCELKEAQIRDGLHIFGQCPQGRQLRDLLIAIARQPGPRRVGLTRAIAQDAGCEWDPLTANPAERWGNQSVGEAIAEFEDCAAALVEQLLAADDPDGFQARLQSLSPLTQAELVWMRDRLLPALRQTPQELTHLLAGLAGRYVPSGPAGAPTRGRPETLPTGRNFYSVDIRALPTETAWDVGRKAAEALVERYTQEQGEYPKTLGLSIWGTATMRTGGDDIAEALALLGVRPVWEGVARRVVDFEILPLSILGRPRVDVTLRISGFFRDAFPNLIDLFDQAVGAVAELDEPADQNPLAAQVQQEIQTWQTAGLSQAEAAERSRYRIFGSKPGAYGAGLQGLIESQNWTDAADLAQAYINWSSYAYTGAGHGRSVPEAFEQRLSHMQVVLHNQDNREHDLLDSDDYYQFQGGLTAAVRTIQGAAPVTYFGDHALPENPKIRRLNEEIARVYRSRVINPKWIAGMMRHGYKGAFELAATVDFLFAYDATADCVADYMYQGVAEAYVFDADVQQFVQRVNPWALREMADRLLEAHQRGLWQGVASEVLDRLQAISLEAEGTIESTTLQGDRGA